MRVGLVSDTHGFFEPRLTRLFEGCGLILHAGDIVGPAILEALARIAPVRAVRGNNDVGSSYDALPELVLLSLGSAPTLLVHQIGGRARLCPPVRRAVERHRPRLLVYGHSHRPFAGDRNGLVFVNPGSAGPRRFRLPRSAATLEVQGGECEVRLHDVDRDELPLLSPPLRFSVVSHPPAPREPL